ncbi:MAG: thiol-disulfide oxidoreductase DCC family protein [Solirubrobacteraceae bacterium]
MTRSTVIYDTDCGFCRWTLALLLRADRERRLRPLALGTPEADELLGDLDPGRRMASWHLVTADGNRTSAGAALPEVLRLLPGGKIPASTLTRIPGPTARAYSWIADHRSTLSRAVPAGSKRRATRLIEARS